MGSDTSTMLLDRLVKEGVKGLDLLMAGMVREGDDASYMQGDESQVGELNSALVKLIGELRFMIFISLYFT